ncbi:hypothetical protein BT96DRAFT_948554 [Gymnopus androsaceus JB14]|uniref:Uncharacterized protein n=1 Tax=Gymnopus androsaceus JB14 TaxID=1447944 RepID=A0A6A4GPN8_9AGAR|nr:hypothetical protein BT96DRAFT_948554 [Gymnopus androsaceus JB14]
MPSTNPLRGNDYCASLNSPTTVQLSSNMSLQKGERHVAGDSDLAASAANITASYDVSCRFIPLSEAKHLENNTLLYLKDCPFLTPSQCIYEGVSLGPYRDSLILQILRAGHQPDVLLYVCDQCPDLWRRHQAAQENAEKVTSAMNEWIAMCDEEEESDGEIIDEAGYLDYWCSLDITGSAERDSLTVALETEFEDFERIVDTLIEERQKRRREIAAELVPIEAAIYSSLCDEAHSRGLCLTLQIEDKLHEMAHAKAVILREQRERERARARTRARQRELATEQELKGQKTRDGPHERPEATFEAGERRHLELRAQAEIYLLEQDLCTSTKK